QPPVADVRSGTQNGACWPDDNNADWPACRFRQGPGSPDACLRPASGLGRPCCGAVERDDRLEPRVPPSQMCPCRNRTAPKPSIPRISCKWNQLTAFFRIILLDCIIMRYTYRCCEGER